MDSRGLESVAKWGKSRQNWIHEEREESFGKVKTENIESRKGAKARRKMVRIKTQKKVPDTLYNHVIWFWFCFGMADEDASISGLFTLERLWLGDGSGVPDFMIGDCIEKITGRDHYLGASFGNRGDLFPEIIKIVYMPEKQKMTLITRDLRFAEVILQ